MTTAVSLQEDWLRAGVKHFSEGGISSLRVENLSRSLNQPVSDFYSYFQDEESFLNQMLLYWRNAKTTRVVENFNREPVEKRLEKLVDTVFADRSLPNFLFHLRNLGRENKKIACLLADIEEERIVPTRSIFKGLGFGQKEIDMKVEILYSFYVGWFERYKYEKFTPELRKQLLEQLHHLLGLDRLEC